jgi:hypothetical protein
MEDERGWERSLSETMRRLLRRGPSSRTHDNRPPTGDTRSPHGLRGKSSMKLDDFDNAMSYDVWQVSRWLLI